MKVLYDHQTYERQRWGGISRYFTELMRGLAGDVEVDLALARSMSEYLGRLDGALTRGVTEFGFPETFLGPRRFPGKKQLRSVVKRLYPAADARRANRENALAKLRAGSFDLFHPTYYDPYFLEALGERPYVLTVYDLTHEVYPEHFAWNDPITRWKRDLVRGARRIIAISEHTRRDLVRLLSVDPARVDVVHLGWADETGGSEPRRPGGLPARYVLFTGTRGQYKNWAFFVRAVAPLLTGDLHLCCTGPPFSTEERGYLELLGLSSRVVHFPAREADLPAAYAHAAAFVFPSLYEGFGFPVLEAFAAGCPAVLADASALPEIGGEAAVYFDPKDAESLQEALRRVLEDAALRRELVARGRARVRTFTWQRTCAATAAVYRRALGG